MASVVAKRECDFLTGVTIICSKYGAKINWKKSDIENHMLDLREVSEKDKIECAMEIQAFVDGLVDKDYARS